MVFWPLFGTAECSILRASGGFVSCTLSPPPEICPERAVGAYRAIIFLYHSKTGQQLFQRSWLTGLELFSASQSTKRGPRFPVNIEKSLIIDTISKRKIDRSYKHFIPQFAELEYFNDGQNRHLRC